MNDRTASQATRVTKAMIAFREQHRVSELTRPAGAFFTMARWGSRPVAQPMVWFASRGCSHLLTHGGCTMCDFGMATHYSWEDVLAELDMVFQRVRGAPIVHLAAPGSFLDTSETPPEYRRQIVRMAAATGAKVIGLEARPEHIRREVLRELIGDLSDSGVREVSVGMGVETADDNLRGVCLNKHSSRSSIVEALAEIRSADPGEGRLLVAEAHVLLKPPALTEREAVDDARRSIRWCLDHGFATVILMPCSARPTTPLGILTQTPGFSADGVDYQPPSLWSVVEVLTHLPDIDLPRIKVHGFASTIELGIRPTTCPACEAVVTAFIQQFNATGRRVSVKAAREVACACRERWHHEYDRKPTNSLDARVESFVTTLERMTGVGSDGRG